MRSNLPLIGACGIALVVASCRTSPSGAASATDVRSSEQPRVSESMERHDRRGIAIRDALVRGDLDLARREARSLAQLGARETLDPARLREMSAAAERVAGASDLPSASHAFGALVKTCGDCHASSTALVAAYGAEPPEPGPGVPTRMTRHEWAANHLWFGLVVPSDGAWSSGAAVLSDPPLQAELLTPGKSPAPAIGALARRVSEVGRSAAGAASLDDRAAIYGDLVATCSACHARLDAR